ncbi:MAG: NAD(P)H-hydrate dehydratase [Candidatus Auribacter fodinae]|jgi:NAD(P)H-hydrate epimerase|uniref:Bifunctional NAD(P)H-hydrate repair enzyme n=1 Tax=Candidatus Auribacter fodinae TaxID=2093366 RepID=A0A3A4R0D3_9BACT|nr:MAG: NAD(P)H-hydrate dehydratase [Candidatus Auribacter fodinae]
MKVVNSEQMASIDRYAIDTCRIPGHQLMEEAGRIVARKAIKFIHHYCLPEQIAIFAWHGNNGGDAMVTAWHLLKKMPDIETHVYFLSTPDKLSEDALKQYKRMEKDFPEYLHTITTTDELAGIKNACKNAGLIIDGLFGTGFQGTPHGFAAEAMAFLNRIKRPILSIDIPSGLNGTTGSVTSVAIKASVTVTFGLPKIGLLVNDGPKYVGKLIVADIGFPEEAIQSVSSDIEWLQPREMKRLLPPRPIDAHKMTFGHLLIIAGSRGMTGAGIMAAQSAFRTGCGMVTLGCPASLNTVFESVLTETITLPLPETEAATLSAEAIGFIRAAIKQRRFNATLIGPGLGSHPSTTELVHEILKTSPHPVILDADAINAVAMSDTCSLSKCAVPVILTPHPGEMGRLLKCSTDEVQKDRRQAVRECANRFGAVTVLKGHNSMITAPNVPVFINTTGNSGLATAGSGDVLAGMIGSFLVQDMTPLEAACAGVYFHGKAGDYSVTSIGQRSMMATDVIRNICNVLR